ncbi:MAG: elongation factor P [Candidatus Glassbacteria bacterium]
MATTADFRNGMIIQVDGQLQTIVEFLHVKPGKGGAFVRTKLKNVKTGAVTDKTFRAGEKVEEVRLERNQAQYVYSSGDLYYFMDLETFEQFPVEKNMLGNQVQYLKENIICETLSHDGKIIGIDLPIFVELEVVETEPGIRGDTAQGGSKPAKLQTGLIIQVPLFVCEGDTIKVDRRTDTYIERV